MAENAKNKVKAQEKRQINLSEKQIELLELRKQGASYRLISRQMIEKRRRAIPPQSTRGLSHEQLRQDCKAALALLHEQLLEDVEEFQQLQVERLEGLMLAHWKEAVGKPVKEKVGGVGVVKEILPPSVASGKLVLQIIAELSELVGVKAAQKHEIKGEIGGTIEHKLSGEVLMTIEQIYGFDENGTE